MVASSSAGFFSSMTPKGRPLTNSTMSGLRVSPVLRDGELVDGEEAVVGGVVEVQDADLRSTNGAVLRPVLHRHAVDQHPVEGAVAGLQG